MINVPPALNLASDLVTRSVARAMTFPASGPAPPRKPGATASASTASAAAAAAAAPNAGGPRRQSASTTVVAIVYILTGAMQPLLMTWAKKAGLADARCQLYMVFQHLGPAVVVVPLLLSPATRWPRPPTAARAVGIAAIHVAAGSMLYVGLTLCGPTIYSVMNSSATVWAALFSYVLLQRSMNTTQWAGALLVFFGLALTALDSIEVGPSVFRGALLVMLGAALHGSIHVTSEWIMRPPDCVSVQMNCAIQSVVTTLAYSAWQIIYTRHHFQEAILAPMEEAGTTAVTAGVVLGAIATTSLVHSLAFYRTIRDFPGGATSAVMMKGLQAVLVFVAGSWLFCGKSGGSEMCLNGTKALSIFLVVGGVAAYNGATETGPPTCSGRSSLDGDKAGGGGYDPIPDVEAASEATGLTCDSHSTAYDSLVRCEHGTK